MKRILVTGEGYSASHFERLSVLGFEVIHKVEIAPDALISLLPTIDAHILGGSERLDADALTKALRLRVVSFVGTGYGSFVDEAAAKGRGIAILNTPYVMVPAVAEHTIGLLLGLARGLFAQNEAIKHGNSWQKTTSELASMTIGIVGMGAVATRVARILVNAFGCTVAYANRTRKPGIESELGLRFADMSTLIGISDAIILLISTTPETTGLLDAGMLSKARPGLLLVNTASPRLVDPIALREALDTGQVAAAAFDGYWIEPLPTPAGDPFNLLTFPDCRFVITPHTAAKTPSAWGRMIAQAVENVIRAFENSTL